MKSVTIDRPQVLDQVCSREYGDESGHVEAVLEANPGLADAPLLLPTGTTILLPTIAPIGSEVPVVTLWT